MVESRPLDDQPNIVAVLLVAAFISLCGIDSRSLWIDELGTWALTQHDSWSAWTAAFLTHTNSDGQLPFYHAYMFLWTRLFGDSEWILRASNIPWLAIALLGLGRLTTNSSVRLWIYAVTAASAFIAYYLNEARPYILYMAGASWLTAGIFRASMPSLDSHSADRSLREILLGSVLLIAGNIIGIFWLASAMVVVVAFFPANAREILRSMWRQKWLVAFTLIIVSSIAGVAVHSYLSGARPQASQFSLAGVAYGIIELSGAAGIGPSRNTLRTGLGAAGKIETACMLIAAALAVAAACMSWLRLPGRQRSAIFAGVTLSMLALVYLGIALQWRVVGRHMSALWPLMACGIAVAVHANLREKMPMYRRGAAVILMACLVISALSMRWLPKHMKDDYRQAAAWAKEALHDGMTVLWIADPQSLAYYGTVPRGHQPPNAGIPKLMLFSELGPTFPAPHPDRIVLSTRDGFNRAAQPLLESGDYGLMQSATTFELYGLETITSTP